MKDSICNILGTFSKEVISNENISSSRVISFLDQIVKELDLETIYVSESTGTISHFIYPYVSTGEASPTMFFNLIVMQDKETKRLVELFKNDGITVFDGNMSSSRRATAEGNLAYGYIVNDKCLGFISFKAKENRVWNDEEKEIIKCLGNIVRPLLSRRQLTDRFCYMNNISKTNVGLFWYYPRLKLIIIPDNTMDKFSVRNFVYRDAPDSLTEEFVDDKYIEDVKKAFEKVTNENKPSDVSFASKEKNNSYYRLSLATNRYDDKNNPIEIMGMVERISKEQKDYEKRPEILKIYENFKNRISAVNVAEFHVDLLNGKVTLFKSDDTFSNAFNKTDNFDSFIDIICEESISKESRDSFKEIMNTRNLRENLMKENDSYSVAANFIINGEMKRFETIIIANRTSIYGYTNDVMVFVRDITHIDSLNYDRLTGLLTMSHFLAKMKEWERKAKEFNEKIHGYIAYFDIKDFKTLNIQCGVGKGDETLKAVSEILKKKYPDGLVSRFSDDHFAVFDIEENKEKSIQKVQEVINEAASINDDFKVEVKVGFHKLNQNVDFLISVDYAQLACQEITNNPLVSIREYDDELKAKTERKKYIIDHIDEATKKHWIKVFFQPVVSTKEVSLVAMEALARWIDPKYGFLSPADFIPVLEENNLLYKLDIYVVEQICQRLRKEIDMGHKVVPISFNLSRNDFLSCKPFDEVEKSIEKYHIDRRLVSIEITESVAMTDPAALHKAVDQFRNSGYEVWIDDFGSGYSSLSILKDFNFDEIKIDMSFMRSFNDRSRTIVANVIRLANDLKIRTLSEGVETKEHFDFLAKAGCERIQGYYFSKPLPYEELMQTLDTKKIYIDN